MTCGWTAAQLRAAINRCEGDAEAAIARHEKPEIIEGKRKGIKMLYGWLARAEAEEHGRVGMANER